MSEKDDSSREDKNPAHEIIIFDIDESLIPSSPAEPPATVVPALEETSSKKEETSDEKSEGSSSQSQKRTSKKHSQPSSDTDTKTKADKSARKISNNKISNNATPNKSAEDNISSRKKLELTTPAPLTTEVNSPSSYTAKTLPNQQDHNNQKNQKNAVEASSSPEEQTSVPTQTSSTGSNSKKKTNLTLAAIGVVIALVLCGGLGWMAYGAVQAGTSPQSKTKDYLQALIDGDGSKALQAGEIVKDKDTVNANGKYYSQEWMETEFYSKTKNRPLRYQVTKEEVDGNSAKVYVDVTQRARSVDADGAVRDKEQTTPVVYDVKKENNEWKIQIKPERVVVVSYLGSKIKVNDEEISVAAALNSLVVPNETASSSSKQDKPQKAVGDYAGAYLVFPGFYSVEQELPSGANKYVSVPNNAGFNSFAQSNTDSRIYNSGAKDEPELAIDSKKLINEHFKRCLESKDKNPKNCPNKANIPQDQEVKNIRWLISDYQGLKFTKVPGGWNYDIPKLTFKWTAETKKKGSNDKFKPANGTSQVHDKGKIDFKDGKLAYAGKPL